MADGELKIAHSTALKYLTGFDDIPCGDCRGSLRVAGTSQTVILAAIQQVTMSARGREALGCRGRSTISRANAVCSA